MSREGFFGWTVVWGAAALAVCGWGLGFYGPPIYLHVIHQSRGWPLALVSAAVTTHYLVGALTVANLPAIYARWGIARATKAGAVALSLGIFGWSLATAPWQLFLAAATSGMGWVTRSCSARVNMMASYSSDWDTGFTKYPPTPKALQRAASPRCPPEVSIITVLPMRCGRPAMAWATSKPDSSGIWPSSRIKS